MSTRAPHDDVLAAHIHPMSTTVLHPHTRPNRIPRREPRVPDWRSFYKNGLPKEVIVIEDSPDLLDSAGNPKNPLPAGSDVSSLYHPRPSSNISLIVDTEKTSSNPPVSLTNSFLSNADASSPRPHKSTKKRKIDDTNDDRSTWTRHDDNHDNSSDTLIYPTGDDLWDDRKRRRTRQHKPGNEDVGKYHEKPHGEIYPPYEPPRAPLHRVMTANIPVVHPERTEASRVKIDDDDGHFIVIPDAYLTSQYRIHRLLGQGTFGKVVLAYDCVRKEHVAVKIIRSVQKYRDAAKIELRVLQTLRNNDAHNRYKCIHPKNYFDYRGHICITMDYLGSSLFDFLKINQFVPFPNSHIQNFAHQLLTSVAFLHDLKLIHTDLKPENILLCDTAYQTFTYNRRIPSAHSSTSRQATQRRVLLNPEIRLIDFGSATFQDEYHSTVVSTRHYRAPEIILGLEWSFPCDIWSIGCILVEFFTGDALFQTHENREHLAMMEAVCGRRIDTSLVQRVNRSSKGSKTTAASYFKRLKLDYPTSETTRGSRRFVRDMKKLSDIIPPTNEFLTNFLDLLQKMFVFDPNTRITAREALQHPWFSEQARDDGTEAARLHARGALSQSGSQSSQQTAHVSHKP